MNPLVSIIVPVYNTEAYLHRCLDSVCNQTYTNIEIICVNDGSTDHSLDMLNEYASRDTRFKVITTKNAGLGAARNVGLRHVAGAWVTGLDSDDYLEPDACSYAISQASDDIDVIQIGLSVREKGKPDIHHRSRLTGKFSVTVDTLVEQPCEFCGKFWRKAFLDSCGCRFPEGFWYEDWFFYWAYLPMARAVLYLPEGKYVYERRPASIMGLTQHKSNKILDHLRVFDLLLRYREGHALPESLACCNIVNFLHCVRFVGLFASETTIAKANEMLVALSLHPLMKPWIKWLRFLEPIYGWRRLFVRREQSLISYGILGCFPFKMIIDGTQVVYRLFGYRIWRYSLNRDYIREGAVD